MFKMYILYSASFNQYYIGHCEVLELRLSRHNGGSVQSTKRYKPWQLIYFEEFATKSEASKRETEIKRKKSRKYIEFLIKGGETGRHVPM